MKAIVNTEALVPVPVTADLQAYSVSTRERFEMLVADAAEGVEHKEETYRALVDVRTLAVEAITATAHAGEKYIELVKRVREATWVPAKSWSLLLRGVGLQKGRVSELLKIASAPDDIFADYCTKQLTFQRAVAAARSAAGLKDAFTKNQLGEGGPVGESDAAGEVDDPTKQPSEKAEEMALAVKLAKAVAKVVDIVVENKFKIPYTQIYRGDDGHDYGISIKRMPSTAKKSASK